MMTQYQINDIVAGSDGYYRVVADGVKDMRLQFDRPYVVGEIVPTFGVVQTPQDSPRINDSKRMVLASTRDYWKHINRARLVCVSRWQNRVEILRFWTYRAYNPTPSSWARIERYQAGVK